MIWKKIYCVGILFLAINFNVYANQEAILADEATVSPIIIEPTHAYWVFSGIVNNENGEQFGYFFQMERQGAQFHVQTAMLDGKTNKVVFAYNKHETIEKSIDNQWKIGDAFLRFNAINESWVFGVKTNDKIGFNFKVDMLNQPISSKEIQSLRPGLEALVHQTSRLNGHIKTSAATPEEFVTANNAWFSKAWLSAKQDATHSLDSGFCRFSDGSGFYAENLMEVDAQSAALASWRDTTGNVVKMSQFINKNFANNSWKISLILPKLEFNLINSLENNTLTSPLIAGFFQDIPKGFCFFSQQRFGIAQKPVLIG